MKKIVALLLAVIMLLSLAACAQPAPAENTKEPEKTEEAASTEKAEETAPAETTPAVDNKDIYLVYVSAILSHPIWDVAKNGFEVACDELGIQGDWVGPQTVFAEEMVQLLDTAVAQGANGCIVQGMCPTQAIESAVKDGVSILLVDGDNPAEGVLAFLGKDLEIQAQLIYDEISKYVAQDEKIVMSIQTSILDDETHVRMNETIEEACKKHPGGYELVNVTLSRGDKATGTTEWINTFNTYPEVNVCVNLAAEGAAACVTAAEELGVADDLVIIGVDDTDETMDVLRAGKIKGTVVTSFWNYGYQAAYWLYENITEGRVPEQRNNDAGTIMVNAENMDNYAEQLKVKVDLPEKK